MGIQRHLAVSQPMTARIDKATVEHIRTRFRHETGEGCVNYHALQIIITAYLETQPQPRKLGHSRFVYDRERRTIFRETLRVREDEDEAIAIAICNASSNPRCDVAGTVAAGQCTVCGSQAIAAKAASRAHLRDEGKKILEVPTVQQTIDKSPEWVAWMRAPHPGEER